MYCRYLRRAAELLTRRDFARGKVDPAKPLHRPWSGRQSNTGVGRSRVDQDIYGAERGSAPQIYTY